MAFLQGITKGDRWSLANQAQAVQSVFYYFTVSGTICPNPNGGIYGVGRRLLGDVCLTKDRVFCESWFEVYNLLRYRVLGI